MKPKVKPLMRSKTTGRVRVYTREERRLFLIARRQFLKQRRRDVAKLKQWLAVWDTWPQGGTFPGLKDGDRLADEFVRNVRKMVARPPLPLPW